MTHTPFRRSASAVLLVSATALAGCATTSAKPPAIAYDDPPREIAATPAAEPPRPVEVVTIPEPLPLPGQLKPVAAGAATVLDTGAELMRQRWFWGDFTGNVWWVHQDSNPESIDKRSYTTFFVFLLGR